MKNIHTDTVEDQVYQIIRDEIRMQTMPPGSRLNEKKLAEQLQVSRSPVREALKRLKGDGLVVTIANRGSFIRSLNDRDVHEMYQARIMFEQFAVCNASFPLAAKAQQQLGECYKLMDRALEECDVSTYLAEDSRFHIILVGLAENHYLIDLYDKLNWQITDVRFSMPTADDYLHTIHSEHAALLAHLLNGKTAAACTVLDTHIRRCEQVLRQSKSHD